MKTIFRTLIYALLVGIFGAVSALAQLDCPAIFQQALESARVNCAGLERNQACFAYGSASLEAAEGYDGAVFAAPGDHIDASAIGSLNQSAESGWALTVMRLQLNQPDAAPAYNSVLLLMGDVSLQQEAVEQPVSALDEEMPGMSEQLNEALGEDGIPAPLQGFSFTSAADSPCAAELPHGIVIQSPNLTPVDAAYLPTAVRVNGWDLSLGSTVLVNTLESGETVAEVLEHFMTAGGQDGDVLVLAGQGIELPAGTPFVGSEDGTVVVVPRPTPEEEGDSWLDELLGEEEVANRPPDDSATTGRVEMVTQDSQIVAGGVWKLEFYDDMSYGDCIMNFWADELEPDYISLEQIMEFDGEGLPTSIKWLEHDYDLEDLGYRYEGRNWALEGMIYEQIDVSPVTPYYIHGRFIGIVRDPYAPRACIHIVPYSLSSCLMDAMYDQTDGSGDCPIEIHAAMGTR